MSIQVRLNMAIGILLAIALFALVATVLFDARPRLAAETESIMKLTEAIVQSSVSTLEHASDPESALRQLVGGLADLRHARIRLRSADRSSADGETPLSDWWDLLAEPKAQQPLLIPVTAGGKYLDTIIISPRSSDELSELYDAVRRIVQYGLALTFGLFALTSILINRALRPVHTLADGMRRMEVGDYTVRVAQSGPPEIVVICDSLNRLAAALQRSKAENDRLSTHIIHAQDEERREIARELHDELGPYLFSIRAAGSLMERELDRPSPDVARAMRHTSSILAHVDALQQTNRRVLQRLSPVGLAELGLDRALRAIVGVWNMDKSAATTFIEISGEIDDADDTTKLTIYRIVQEGLTNAHRHAAATDIRVSILAYQADPPAQSGFEITISDDGKGISEPLRDGFGLTAMRERISALGGRLSISLQEGGGTVLCVHLPAPVPSHPASSK